MERSRLLRFAGSSLGAECMCVKQSTGAERGTVWSECVHLLRTPTLLTVDQGWLEWRLASMHVPVACLACQVTPWLQLALHLPRLLSGFARRLSPS